MEEIKSLIRDVLRENTEIIRNDHDLLVEIKAMMGMITVTQNDHEKRIRVVEKILFYGVGALLAMKVILDAVRH